MSAVEIAAPIGTVVDLTPDAVRQVKFLIRKRGQESAVLRLGVKGGGCSGLSYTMKLEDAATARDTVYDVDGITVAIDPKSAKFLAGTRLDYSLKRLMDGGWVWTNPNADRTCGCGTSFTPAR